MTRPTLELEKALWAQGKLVAGLDEVGRGPLAGPVVASAVILPPDQPRIIPGLDDSKKLSAARREEIATAVAAQSLCWSVAAASVGEIDRLNIRKASALAMRRCLARLPLNPDHVLVDGNPLPEIGREHQAVVKGDSVSQSIAAASVLAKVLRDHLMTLLARRHPEYGWSTNMGYGTRDHLDALDRRGPTKHHRTCFTPVSQLRLF